MQDSSPGRPFRPTVVCIWPDLLRASFPKIWFTGAVGILTALSFAVHASGTVLTVPMPGISAIETDVEGVPIVVDGAGGRHLVTMIGGKIVLKPAADRTDRVLPYDSLPDAEVAVSPSVDRAWLGAPTRRYAHGVLGDDIEAGTLYLSRGDGPVLTLTLDGEAVFEDRYPRFEDMNGDGDLEILVVKAYQHAGAALVLIDPDVTPLSITAEADAIGTPNRWLNPVGVGDVDNDGRPEALVVITPHIGGTLTAYEWHGSRLVVDHEIHGFSNHQIGSRELALSAVRDLDGDGIAEVIVPDGSRRAMQIVRFDKSKPEVIANVSAAARVAHRLVVYDLDRDGRPELVWGAEDGTLVVWQPAL